MRALAPLLLAVVVAPAASWVSAPLARSRNTAISAKKKGGGGKKKGGVPKHKQQSSFEKAANFELKPYESNAGRQLAELVVNSYGSRTGKPIHGDLDDRLQPVPDLPKALWSAPVAVMVVGVPDGAPGGDGDDETAAAAAPTCKWANLAAVEALGLGKDFGKLVGAPVTLPAALGGDKPYESGYTKKLGPEHGGVTLLDAARWSLDRTIVVDGALAVESVGVAYRFEAWEGADGARYAPGGVVLPAAIDTASIEEAVAAQAAEVRRLKEDEGLGNKDEAVVAAVAELLRLKAELEDA